MLQQVGDEGGVGVGHGITAASRTAPGRDRSTISPICGGAVALGAQQVERAVHLVRRDHHDHADAEVEDLAHLVVAHLAEPLDLTEDPRRLPRAEDRCCGVGALGEHADDVAREAAAGDVGDRAHVDLPEQRGDGRRVDDRRHEQLVAEAVVGARPRGLLQVAAGVLEEHLAGEGVAVGAQARARAGR